MHQQKSMEKGSNFLRLNFFIFVLVTNIEQMDLCLNYQSLLGIFTRKCADQKICGGYVES
jgi:hypothetical protein